MIMIMVMITITGASMFEDACSESLDPARTRNSQLAPREKGSSPSIVDYVRIKQSTACYPAAIVIRFGERDPATRNVQGV